MNVTNFTLTTWFVANNLHIMLYKIVHPKKKIYPCTSQIACKRDKVPYCCDCYYCCCCGVLFVFFSSVCYLFGGLLISLPLDFVMSYIHVGIANVCTTRRQPKWAVHNEICTFQLNFKREKKCSTEFQLQQIHRKPTGKKCSKLHRIRKRHALHNVAMRFYCN